MEEPKNLTKQEKELLEHIERLANYRSWRNSSIQFVPAKNKLEEHRLVIHIVINK